MTDIIEHVASLTADGEKEDNSATELSNEVSEDPVIGRAAEEVETEEVATEDVGELRRAADGRLNEIVNLRQQLSSVNSNIEEMRQLVMEATEPDPVDTRQQEIDQYGEDVVDHPSVRYMADKMRGLENRINDLQPDPQQAREQKNMEQLIRTTQASVSKFKESNPDYDNAYKFARDQRRKMYMHLDTVQQEELLNRDELMFTVSALQQGKDPAGAMWELAANLGFSSNLEKPEPSPVDVGKIKAGVQQSNVTSLPGRSARQGDVVTIEMYKNLPRDQKMVIAGNPDKFEQLMRTGSTTFD